MKRFPLVLACLIGGATLFAQAQEPGSDVYVSPAPEHRLQSWSGRSGAREARRQPERSARRGLRLVRARRRGRAPRGRPRALSSARRRSATTRPSSASTACRSTPRTAPGSPRARVDPAVPAREPLRTRRRGESLWIVQFAGPIRDEWLERLRATGAVDREPDGDQRVRRHRSDRAALPAFALLRTDPAIQWIGAYHPFFRLAPELRALDFAQAATVDVTMQLIAGDGAARLETSSTARGSRCSDPAERVLDYVNVRISVPAAVLPALAAHPAVFAIEPMGVYRLWTRSRARSSPAT